ncbi:tannase/feruloyl esterase family alpha/beta hydrolase [Actinomadura kijaniata]|uniref:Feruloyl esterase n=1 Tax=Actinomadura namibiensis TaxID=182080 RepID=A0A7W3M0K8_ACTNM|nr:tannase/feruloyl esterase family alpha/beta hydrolase [Actinomadura namibiensis]MBA8957783.1 feruloyl esterase [Actinomadura namibiensis]
MNRYKILAVGGAVALSGVTAGPARSAAAPADEACTRLAGLAIPASAIGLPTGGGHVRQATPVPASGQGASAVGAHCRVDAALRPVDPEAPDILMRVALPAAWNGKAMMFGGGGYDGTIPNIAGNVPYGPSDRPTPLGRGYATFAGDSGHQAAPGFQPTTSLDGSFALNDEALRNFAGDALKKTRDAALHLIGERYGGARPSRSYFAGGSTGGREGLAVAQRWPRDFDGVIAVHPAWNAATLDLFFGYEAQVLSRPGAFPGPAEQELLHRSVVDACDGGDGLRDGVVSNERGCRFDPRVLRCTAHPTGTCLTDRQIRAVRALSSPLRLPYRLASGETGYPGFPFLSGAAMTTPLLGMGTTAPARPMLKTSGYGVQFWDQWIRYAVTRDPAHDSLSVDPRHPGRWRDRISRLSALQDVNDPDLRPFARAGGRLIIVHGLADELVSHRSTAQYFARVNATMGADATRRFARFYTVPGANHVNVKAAFAAGWDSLTALENWRERATAPRDPVVTDVNPGASARTRPLCEYPAWPRYQGTGDPGAATSFTCRRF